METLNHNFLEFISLLENNRVRYMVVGGYAVGLYGFPRYTGDIDFFIMISEDNASRLMRVFETFGFGDIGIEEQDFKAPDFVIEIGREPYKIQILTGIDGVEFKDAYCKSIEVILSGVNVRFIGKEDLIRNKKATGRPKDKIDVIELERLS